MYIRTKDGIYEVEWNNNVEMWCDVKTHKGFILDSMISKEDYILADTIDELCDGFYVQINDWKFDTTYLFDNLENAIKESEDWKSYSDRKYVGYEIVIYAFIKTNKGLIYVAKMDNDGKLVLI